MKNDNQTNKKKLIGLFITAVLIGIVFIPTTINACNCKPKNPSTVVTKDETSNGRNVQQKYLNFLWLNGLLPIVPMKNSFGDSNHVQMNRNVPNLQGPSFESCEYDPLAPDHPYLGGVIEVKIILSDGYDVDSCFGCSFAAAFTWNC